MHGCYILLFTLPGGWLIFHFLIIVQFESNNINTACHIIRIRMFHSIGAWEFLWCLVKASSVLTSPPRFHPSITTVPKSKIVLYQRYIYVVDHQIICRCTYWLYCTVYSTQVEFIANTVSPEGSFAFQIMISVRITPDDPSIELQ